MPPSKSKKRSANRVVINVGGIKHETFLSTLRNIPDTRLYNLSEHHTSLAKVAEYDSTQNEYFFDRHPQAFAEILNYYRTGKLHCPSNVCGPLFETELEFWGIDEEQVEMCCWENYKQHREKQEKLKYFRIPEEELENTASSRASELFEEDEERPSRWSRIKFKVWRALEEPYSSSFAKAIGITSLVVFIAFIIKFTLSTLPYFQERNSVQFMVLNIIHLISTVWFSMEFVLRAIVSPNKVEFLKRVVTWLDMISLIPMYMFVLHPRFLEDLPHLEMLVMLKVARIFQLFKLSYVIQVLTNTLKASSRELCLLLVIMGFQTVVFSSILYFLERKEKTKDYISVPHSMWWTIITMTTGVEDQSCFVDSALNVFVWAPILTDYTAKVGYGDVYPRTWFGKIIGSVCAICGVLVIALPVSVVATNFSLFYTYAKARLNIPPKKKRVAIAHALTAMRIPKNKSSGGEASLNGNRGSLKFSSIGSAEGRRDTTAQPTPVESEMSLTPTLGPSSYKKYFKDSYLSLQSVTSLRPPEVSYNSRSLNSIPPELSKEQREQQTRENIMFRLDPPSRASSFVDISKSKVEKNSEFQKENNFRAQSTKSLDDQTNDSSTGLTPFLLPARLRMRRGAISMASLSLKSASSNSSYLHWRTSKDGLEDDGPFIILPTNFSLQSLSSLKSGINCSCSSLKTLGKDVFNPEKKDKQNGESVITIPVPVLRQQPKTRNASTCTEPDESDLEQLIPKDGSKTSDYESHSFSPLYGTQSKQDNTLDTERDMVYLVFPADVIEDKEEQRTSDDKKSDHDIEQSKTCSCYHGSCSDNGSNIHISFDSNVSTNLNSPGLSTDLPKAVKCTNISVLSETPQGKSSGDIFKRGKIQNSCPGNSSCELKFRHASTSCLGLRNGYDATTVNNNELHLDHFPHNHKDLSQYQTLTGKNRFLSTDETRRSQPHLANGCLRHSKRLRASCPIFMPDATSCVGNSINCATHTSDSSTLCDATRNLQPSSLPQTLLNQSTKVQNCNNYHHKHFNPHFHSNSETEYGKHQPTSV